MKGIELPINTLIIIVIALAIFLALIALFYGTWNPSSSIISLGTAKESSCHMLVSTGCKSARNIFLTDFDADQDGYIHDPDGGVNEKSTDVSDCGPPTGNSGDNLHMLCRCWYNIYDTDEDELDRKCREEICGCE